MFRDLMRQSLKEITRYSVRSILILLSVFVSSIMISLLFYTSSHIADALTYMVGVQSPEVNQLMIKEGDHKIQFDSIDKYIESTSALQARVQLMIPVVDSLLSIKGKTYDSYSIFIFSGDYALFTNQEAEAAVDTIGTSKEKSKIYFSEQFLLKYDIDLADAMDNTISFVLLDTDGNTHTVSTSIAGVIKKSLHANMNLEEHCDIYVDGNIFTQNTDVPANAISVLFEYRSHQDVQEAASFFENENYDVTVFDDKISDLQADTLIYNIICWLMEGLVLITVAISVLITFSVSFEEHKNHYGMLKAIGYSNGNIFVLCILQTIIIGSIGAILGFVLTMAVGDFAIKTVLNSLITGLNYDLQLKITFEQAVFLKSTGSILLSCIFGGMIPTVRIVRQPPMNLLNNIENE